MQHQSSNNCSHQRGADEEGVPVLEGVARLELEDEIVVYPAVLPHKQIATIHEQMQAQQCKHAANCPQNQQS